MSKAEELVEKHRIELLEEEERESTTPTVAFYYGASTQENADTFRILVCCERQGPTAHSISFFIGSSKILVFRRITLQCDNEPSTKSIQYAVIHACVGLEVIPQGPHEGGHMEMAV